MKNFIFRNKHISFSFCHLWSTFIYYLKFVPHLFYCGIWGESREFCRMQSALHDVHRTLVKVGLHDLVPCPCIVVFWEIKRSFTHRLPDLVVLSSQKYLHLIFSISIVRPVEVRKLIDRVTFSNISSIFHCTFLQDVNPLRRAPALIPRVRCEWNGYRGGWIDPTPKIKYVVKI